MLPTQQIDETLSEALRTYKTLRRALPWRKTKDPYKILVSEYMLQQTQVGRVLSKYETFIERFPTVQALAQATPKEVLTLWSGLGYNRRALALHRAARCIVEEHSAVVPKTEEVLRTLPGIGTYTAAAITAFAYNRPTVMLETNIRTALLYHCFKERSDAVDDREIIPYLTELHDRGRERGHSTRTIYSALMDYGSHLKAKGVQINKKSKHYKPQSTFNGSLRQARGAILKTLISTPNGVSKRVLKKETGLERIEEALEALVQEGVVQKHTSHYLLTGETT